MKNITVRLSEGEHNVFPGRLVRHNGKVLGNVESVDGQTACVLIDETLVSSMSEARRLIPALLEKSAARE